MKLQDPGDALWRSLSADWSDVSSRVAWDGKRMTLQDPVKPSSRSLSTDLSHVSSRVAWDGKRMKLQDPGKDLLRSLSTDWSHVSLGVTWERARTGESSESCPCYSKLAMTRVHSNLCPNLWIGNQWNSNDEAMLTSNGITHVLSLIGRQSSVCWVQRKEKPMHDGGRSDIKDVLEEVYEFMEGGLKGNNNLLVHCHLGQNRSAVIVIAFLMKKFKITLHRAHRALKKVRPLVQVNVDYAKQLLNLEREYFGSNSLPSNWMEREYTKAADAVIFKHENMTTERQKLFLKRKDISSS